MRPLGRREGGRVTDVPAVVDTKSPTVCMNLGLLTLQTQGVGEGSLAMYLKKIAAGAAMIGTLGFTAVGLGAGTASAAPPAPVVAGILWQQDRGHGGDGGHWGHGDGRGWDDRGGWGYGGNWGYGPSWGCITGPFGHVSWCP